MVPVAVMAPGGAMMPMPMQPMQPNDAASGNTGSSGPAPSAGGYAKPGAAAADSGGSGGNSPSPTGNPAWPPPPPELAPGIERVPSGSGPAPQFSPSGWSQQAAADR